MQPSNGHGYGPGQPSGGPMRPGPAPPGGAGVGVWQVPALVFCGPVGPQMAPVSPEGFVVCENWGPQGFTQFTPAPFPQPQSFDHGMAQSSAATGVMPMACMQRPSFDGYQEQHFDAQSSSGWPAAKDWQGQPMPTPNFQPMGFVGVGPCPGPMPMPMEMVQVPVPQMPQEPPSQSMPPPPDMALRPFRPANQQLPWRRNFRSSASSSQSASTGPSGPQNSWNGGSPEEEGLSFGPGRGEEPCYGDEGPCDCRYCEPGEHRSRQSRHWRSGLRSSDLWEAPLPCGLLPSDVSELLFRDIVPEDYEMLLQLDDAVEKRVASTEGVDALPSASEDDFAGQNCTVCLAALERDEDIAKLPCTHVFHRRCVAKWLTEQKRACPLCNEEI
eukprot:s7872_g2.t1